MSFDENYRRGMDYIEEGLVAFGLNVCYAIATAVGCFLLIFKSPVALLGYILRRQNDKT